MYGVVDLVWLTQGHQHIRDGSGAADQFGALVHCSFFPRDGVSCSNCRWLVWFCKEGGQVKLKLTLQFAAILHDVSSQHWRKALLTLVLGLRSGVDCHRGKRRTIY